MTKDKIIEKTMLEFKQGKLRSGSGEIVTKRSQALAIALSKANSGKFGLGGVPKPIIELFEQGQEFLSKKYPSAQGNQSLEDTELFWDMVEDIRKHFDTETPTKYGEVGEDIVRHYLSKKFAEGGKINENLEMINSDNKAIIHHAEELKIILKKNKDIPTWAVALINQAENNISNVTHYLDGKLAYDYGGMIPEVLQKVYGENLVFIDCFAQERIGMINNLYPDHAEVFIDGQFEDVPNWRITKILSKDIELNKQLIKEIQDTYMLNVGDETDVMGLESMANGGKLVANLGAYLLAGESAKKIAPKSVNALDERLAERLNPTKPSIWEDRGLQYSDGGGVPDRIMEISMARLKSEFRNEPQIFSGEIIKRGPNEIKIENGILYIKRPNENWQQFSIIKFGDGGGVGIKNGEKFKIILDTNYGIETEPYEAIVEVVDNDVNSRGQVTVLHITGKMKGTKTDIQVSSLKNKYSKGGGVPYKYPKYNLPIYGTYVFKTPSETFELEIYMSERRNDTEDSLVVEEVKNSNVQLGSIIVKNSALTRLTKGMKVKAKSSIGNYSGTIEKIN